ncbi:hypothetical protein [Nostoc sp.]|uniref:hypothetical protein n=1 Tax=Nostoc sp. TaxID=1180 RepID=UPI002FFBFC6F
MTGQPPILHEAFKQFERDKFSLVAQGYDQAMTTLFFSCSVLGSVKFKMPTVVGTASRREEATLTDACGGH